MYRAGTGNFGEFSPYTINFRGLCKSGGARAPAAPPSSVPMIILFLFFQYRFFKVFIIFMLKSYFENLD